MLSFFRHCSFKSWNTNSSTFQWREGGEEGGPSRGGAQGDQTQHPGLCLQLLQFHSQAQAARINGFYT